MLALVAGGVVFEWQMTKIVTKWMFKSWFSPGLFVEKILPIKNTCHPGDFKDLPQSTEPHMLALCISYPVLTLKPVPEGFGLPVRSELLS